jgi:hypothetical protein
MTGISDNSDSVVKDDLPHEEHDNSFAIPADASSNQEAPVSNEQPGIEHVVETPPQEIKVAIKCDVKCKDCANNKSGHPEIVLDHQATGGLLTIKFNARCGCPSRVVINQNFELVEHSCTSFRARDIGSDSFDFDEFLESDKEIDDVLVVKPAKPAQKLVSIEETMKAAVKKLAKPLALLIPTTAQKKTEAQLRSEREIRMKELVGTEVNLVYLRVLEFEKLASGTNSFPIDKLCKALKDLDKGAIIGFIKKVNNDFLIEYNEQSQVVRFFNPSKPELEILSREFEKWLRFNRL